MSSTSRNLFNWRGRLGRRSRKPSRSASRWRVMSLRESGIESCTSTVSRTSLKRFHCRSSSQPITPRGKKTSFTHHSLNQERAEDLSLHPRPARTLLLFRQLPHLEQRFQTLEGEFQLPP